MDINTTFMIQDTNHILDYYDQPLFFVAKNKDEQFFLIFWNDITHFSSEQYSIEEYILTELKTEEIDVVINTFKQEKNFKDVINFYQEKLLTQPVFLFQHKAYTLEFFQQNNIKVEEFVTEKLPLKTVDNVYFSQLIQDYSGVNNA